MRWLCQTDYDSADPEDKAAMVAWHRAVLRPVLDGLASLAKG